MSILLSDSDVKNALKNICGALRDLVPFVQFKKREKHPWRSANFSNWFLYDKDLLHERVNFTDANVMRCAIW